MVHTRVELDKRLYRLDNSTWSYDCEALQNADLKEIRVSVNDVQAEHAFTIANCVATIFEQNPSNITLESLSKGIDIRITKENVSHPIHGKWTIAAKKTQASWYQSFSSIFPFLRTITPKNIVEVTVSKAPESVWNKVSSLFSSTIACEHAKISKKIFQKPIETQLSWEKSVCIDGFLDPFTELATKCLTTVEPHFVMEQAHTGSWRFAFNPQKDTLLLKKISCNTLNKEELQEYQEENRAVVTYFKNYLENEFGPWFVSFLAENYDINLKKMADEGLPLYPDHVSKCNIGVQNIEISHADQLLQKLRAFNERLQTDLNPNHSSITLSNAFQTVMTEGSIAFSHREIRGLLRQVQNHKSFESREEITLVDIQEYLHDLLQESSEVVLTNTSSRICSQIISMLVATHEERERAFTGRKIRHLSIMGFHTMGNKQIACSARDMFELLHIFPDMQKKQEWPDYYELLGHVVAKKSLYRKSPKLHPEDKEEKWHVGLILPSPTSSTGETRWYYNNEFVDDGCGNVNYMILPVCNKCEGMRHPEPAIKFYRSTASDHNAMNWQDSLQADLNPYGSPGSLNPDVSYRYEKEVFHKRTIPLWVAYGMAAFKLLEEYDKLEEGSYTATSTKTTIDEYLTKSVSTLTTYFDTFYPREKQTYLPYIEQLLKERKYKELQECIAWIANKYDELPQNKIAQNMAFVGHSLGGGLAQFSTYFFGTRVDRIPLPGCFFTCYSSDGPAIDTDKDTAFMNFGRSNKKLLELLGQKWKIFHQFEYGDFVPQAGGSHLGTNGYDKKEDASWLDFRARVFRPLPTAEALSITSAPTHGRRIGTATSGKDYVTTNLTAGEVYQFDHSYFLNGSLANVFGYVLLRSPKVTEQVRQLAAKLLYPVNRLIDAAVGNKIGSRDENGVFYANIQR